MQPNDDYKVQLEVFEGPLDLLLYLIKKDELDIYDIPIERITNQYMQYMDMMRMLDLNIAGEFLVMAATLMMIKSRMLLPVEERPELDKEEDDPRWDLVRQLLEYKKFKDAAAFLQKCENDQGNAFLRGTDPLVSANPEPAIGIGDVSLFDLIAALNEALKRVKVEELGQIFAEQFTVADKIETLLRMVQQEPHIRFSRLFVNMASRAEIVCTFLALLELIRLRQITAQQEKEFGDILIMRSALEVAGPAPVENAVASDGAQDPGQ